ncbi:FAR1-related sequence 5-like protein [Tanacetum coccineum]
MVDNDELVAMFWADEVAKCLFWESQDFPFESLVIPLESYETPLESHVIPVESHEIPVESFQKNLMYNMKFVSFIGIDNHGKCVTLGSGMLLHEDIQSYTWLLTAFMTAFLKEPTMIVTDQDGAMKRAIEAVFKKSKHRLCMWHIMQKIPSKISMESQVIHIEIRISLESQMIHVESQVIRIESHVISLESHVISLESHICKEIYNETDFKERFDKIVCNMFIEPLEFEEKWAQLIEDFGLQSHKWLKKMFNLREI